MSKIINLSIKAAKGLGCAAFGCSMYSGTMMLGNTVEAATEKTINYFCPVRKTTTEITTGVFKKKTKTVVCMKDFRTNELILPNGKRIKEGK